MKKMFVLVVGVIIANISSAAWLCWQVNGVDSPNDTAGYSGAAFNEARVFAVNGSSRVDLETFGGDETSYSDVDNWAPVVEGNATDKMYVKLDDRDWSEYSFYIELGSYDETTGKDTVVGSMTEGASYGSIETYITDMDPRRSATPAAVWHGTGYAVPEPTGGVLVLLGMGLLGLKRKRIHEAV